MKFAFWNFFQYMLSNVLMNFLKSQSGHRFLSLICNSLCSTCVSAEAIQHYVNVLKRRAAIENSFLQASYNFVRHSCCKAHRCSSQAIELTDLFSVEQLFLHLLTMLPNRVDFFWLRFLTAWRTLVLRLVGDYICVEFSSLLATFTQG